MTPWWVENLSDWPQIVHGPFFYINPEFETGGAGIWKKKLNLGTPNVHCIVHVQSRSNLSIAKCFALYVYYTLMRDLNA